MAVFEVESWHVQQGKEEAQAEAMRQWLQWVSDHRDLFEEWKSVRYFVKYYKQRRGDYSGPYEEYKKNDPYYKDLFIHSSMKVEVWQDLDRDLWIE
jgi:hypothetical protein